MVKKGFLLGIIAVGTILSACVKEDEGSRLKPGDEIPSFTVDGPYGTFSSGDLAGGGLLVLFASYCGTCQAVMPQIQRLWDASAGGTLFAVGNLSRQGVNGEDEKSVAEYWSQRGYTMPYYLDTDGGVYYRFARETIPRIYVVGKDRRIAYMSVGDSSVTAEELAAEIEKALGIRIDL